MQNLFEEKFSYVKVLRQKDKDMAIPTGYYTTRYSMHENGFYYQTAEKYFFRPADIGDEFVRTQPYAGFDHTFMVHRTNTREESALKLIGIHSDHLEFTQRQCSIQLKTDGKPENWDDGFWTSVKKCGCLFAKTQSQVGWPLPAVVPEPPSQSHPQPPLW